MVTTCPKASSGSLMRRARSTTVADSAVVGVRAFLYQILSKLRQALAKAAAMASPSGAWPYGRHDLAQPGGAQLVARRQRGSRP